MKTLYDGFSEIGLLNVIAYFFLIILSGVALINVMTLFDEGKCVCTKPVEICTYKSQVPESLIYDNNEGCFNKVCRDLAGECRKIPKVIDIGSYIRIN